MGTAPVVAVSLMGPTASGKSDVALALAESYPFEIISVDSAQVYRGMDIGTAKVDAATRSRLPHHLIDIRNPDEPYSVAEFCDDAREVAADIVARQKIPLLVGGTMLYFKGLIEGIADLPAADEEVRRSISEIARREGWETVHRILAEVDPASAAQINASDPQRIQRALEVYRITGVTMSELTKRATGPRRFPWPLLQIALVPRERSVLNKRIEERFLAMLEEGLIEEVRALGERFQLHGELPAMKAVGYRQVWKYLAGELDYDEMVTRGLSASRSLAKRQMTWLRGWDDLVTVTIEGHNPLDEVLKIVVSRDIVEDPSGKQRCTT